MHQRDDRSEIALLLRAYHSAMVDARTDDLATMLDEHFSLVHITGYVQPKHEWFGVIRSGAFDYHRIDVDEQALSVTVSHKAALAAGRGIFDATIEGSRRPWRLRFALRLAKRGNGWRIAEARYSSF
jgi:hypothetical protein